MSDVYSELQDILAGLRQGGPSIFEEQVAAARRGRTVSSLEARRAHILALIEHGATEGERAAARAALARIDSPSHSEQDRMQRGGNYSEE